MQKVKTIFQIPVYVIWLLKPMCRTDIIISITPAQLSFSNRRTNNKAKQNRCRRPLKEEEGNSNLNLKSSKITEYKVRDN